MVSDSQYISNNLNRSNIKRAFVYKDEKSHKFWWIDYSDCSFAVNYAKYGSIRKYEVKEFDSEGDGETPFGSDEGHDTLIEGMPWNENEIQSKMIEDLQPLVTHKNRIYGKILYSTL